MDLWCKDKKNFVRIQHIIRLKTDDSFNIYTHYRKSVNWTCKGMLQITYTVILGYFISSSVC